MCQVTEDDLSGALESRPDFKTLRKCLKCDQNPIIVTRINDALCKSCFLEYFNHKFRSLIGKTKIFEKNDRILFAYSASGSSVSMLNLIHKGVGEDAKKKLLFNTRVLFVEDSCLFDPKSTSESRLEFIKRVEQSVAYTGFEKCFSLLEYAIEDNPDLLFADSPGDLVFDETKRNRLVELVNDIKSQTSRREFIKRLRDQLINKIAKKLEIQKVVFANTCTKLTIELLSNVAIGKGAHISGESSLSEELQGGLIHLRPFRELTSKEAAFYNHLTRIGDHVLVGNAEAMKAPNSDIYRLTEKFINGLQNNFPTTVSTIFRTSDKLTPSEDDSPSDMCTLCYHPIDTKVNANATSSAIGNLDFAVALSKINTEKLEVNNNQNLCYSCSIIAGELKDKTKLPESLKEKMFANMKAQIQDFLIE